MSGPLHPKVKYPKKVGVRPKRDKTPAALIRERCNAALTARGNPPVSLRQKVAAEFRRREGTEAAAKRIEARLANSFEDEADELEGLL